MQLLPSCYAPGLLSKAIEESRLKETVFQEILFLLPSLLPPTGFKYTTFLSLLCLPRRLFLRLDPCGKKTVNEYQGEPS
jgi:hypothetical protein